MAAAETARLIASLELQDKNFTRGIRNVERGIGRVDKKLSAFGGFVNRNLARGVDRFAASLVDGVFAGVESLQELEKAQAQTAAVLKSTGQAAGINGAEVTALAEKYESLNAIVGDEFIRSGENMLLTFTNIKKDAFEPALAVALDLNTAMGKGPEGLTSTVIQVGKALNDPTKGLTALRKVGVSFTESQVKQIKALQKTGDLYGAQQIILKELNKEFGGSFAAEGDTTAGKVAKFNDAVEDLQRTFAKALLPIISKVADKLGTFLGDPAVVKGIEDAGIALGQAFDGMLAAAEKVNWGAIAGGLKAAAGFAGDLVGWFGKFPDWAQALIVGGFVATKLPIVGDIFSEAAKGLIKGVLGINAGIVNVNGPVAGVPGGAGGAGGAAGGMGKIATLLAGTLSVGIIAASIAAIGFAFKQVADSIGIDQANLLAKVNATSEQGFTETINNLKATNTAIQNMNPLENVLAGIFGGSEIVKNFEMATSRIDSAFKAGELSREEMLTAIGALEETLRLNPEVKLPGTEALLKDLIAAVNKNAQGPDAPEKRPRVSGVGDRPSPGNPGEFRKNIDKIGFEKWLTAAGNIKNAITTESGAQKAELANIKNASATLNTTTSTGLGTVSTGITTAAAAAGTAASNIATTARMGLSNAAVAARNAGTAAANASSNGASRIVAAVNALDLSVNVTTVNKTSTINNRYGPSGGSSTYDRSATG